jgi:hypothetical protein
MVKGRNIMGLWLIKQHIVKKNGRVQTQLHPLSIWAFDGSCRLHALPAFPRGERAPNVPWTGQRAGLVAVKKRKICCPCQESNHDSPTTVDKVQVNFLNSERKGYLDMSLDNIWKEGLITSTNVLDKPTEDYNKPQLNPWLLMTHYHLVEYNLQRSKPV